MVHELLASLLGDEAGQLGQDDVVESFGGGQECQGNRRGQVEPTTVALVVEVEAGSGEDDRRGGEVEHRPVSEQRLAHRGAFTESLHALQDCLRRFEASPRPSRQFFVGGAVSVGYRLPGRSSPVLEDAQDCWHGGFEVVNLAAHGELDGRAEGVVAVVVLVGQVQLGGQERRGALFGGRQLILANVLLNGEVVRVDPQQVHHGVASGEVDDGGLDCPRR